MSQKHTLSSIALAAVLAGAVFAVTLMLFLFLADYRFMSSLFLAFIVALVAGIVLFIGFGAPQHQPATASARSMAGTAPSPDPAPSPAATPPAPEPAPVVDDSAEKQAEAERQAAAEKAAAEADAAAKAQAEAIAKAEAAAAAKAEAAAELARAKAEKEAAAAPSEPVTEAAEAAPATDHGIPDYDGDGKLEGTGEGSRPAGLDAPRDGKADDLKQIKGIGPKLEKLCNRLGFWHFDQVAAWTSDEVAWVDANLEGFKGRVTRDKWVEQAALLASGGETEFSKRVEDGDVY